MSVSWTELHGVDIMKQISFAKTSIQFAFLLFTSWI